MCALILSSLRDGEMMVDFFHKGLETVGAFEELKS